MSGLVQKSPNVVFQTVDDFLENMGYDPQIPSQNIDGHEIRRMIAQALRSHCAMAPETDCSREALKNLFDYMRDIPGWNQVLQGLALLAGGYEADFIPWLANVETAGPS